jgi:hypothetical protein
MPARKLPPKRAKHLIPKAALCEQRGLFVFDVQRKARIIGLFQLHIEKAPIYCVFLHPPPFILQESL